MYLVTGATGNVGSELVRALHADGEPVRAIVHSNPADDGFPTGVDVRSGDLTDPSTLRDAWEGVRGVFLLPGYDQAPTFLRDARAAGVERLVLLSGGSAGSGDMSNAISAYMIASETAVRASGLSWTILRPSAFMTNALRWRDKLDAGDVLRLPFAGVRTAAIDPFDLAAVARAALLDDRHAERTYTPTGPESLLPADQVRILGEVLGRPLSVEAQPDEEARKEMLTTTPPQYVDAFFDSTSRAPSTSPRSLRQSSRSPADGLARSGTGPRRTGRSSSADPFGPPPGEPARDVTPRRPRARPRPGAERAAQ